MVDIAEDRAAQRRRRIFTAICDSKRGWRINWKALGVAYVVEAAIIGSSLAAGIQFANRYADDTPSSVVVAQIGGWNLPVAGHSEAWWMAVIATIAFCVAETVRLPLVHGFRTANSWIMRGVLLLGILMACGITVKSMSQVAEQMFHPRLRFVQEANAELAVANADLKKIETQKVGPTNALDPMQKAIERQDRQIEELNTSLQGVGKPPPDRKVVTKYKHWFKNEKGKKVYDWATKTTYEKVPWEGKPIVGQIADARAKRDALAVEPGQQQDKVDNFDQQVADQKAVVTAKENAHQKAVADSQLHSFTAMVFGVDPREVRDAQVHWFLRIFVFFPSIFVALASSLLAMSAYESVRKRDKDINVHLSIDEKDGTIAKYIDDLVHNKIHEERKFALAA